MSVYIGAATKDDYSAMRGPCPEGFHVPTREERETVMTIGSTISARTTSEQCENVLNLTNHQYINYVNGPYITTVNGAKVRTCTVNSNIIAYAFATVASNIEIRTDNMNNGIQIRPFKDKPVIPDSSWTTVVDGSSTASGAGVFSNSSLGLISLSGDGITRITMTNKNLGAPNTTSAGYYYQRGNNNGFADGPYTTSSTQVDCTGYGPGNYYSSDVFITTSPRSTSSYSVIKNLWGGDTGVQQTPRELKSAYIGEYINRECIIYKMNADSSGNLYAPIGGYAHNGSAGATYDWSISIDGGTPTRYTGTGTQQGNITLSGYTSGTNHTIKITPVTETYGRALAFGFAVNPTSRGLITEIVRDGSYMGYAESATNTGDNFRAYQYYGCEQLTSVPDEYMPDTVTTIGVYFRAAQYAGCPSITASSVESLPNSVSSIGDSFRYWQYLQNTGITEIKGWKDLSVGGTNYRKQQYAMCSAMKTVTVIGDVGYSSSDSTSLQNSYVSTVSVPTAYLSNYKDATAQPWASIDDSKFIGY